MRATLSPPPGPALPGDYDFARAAWFQGLGAVGYRQERREGRAECRRSRRCRCSVSAAIARVRQAIGRRVVAALPGETGAIANALITGERGGITEATNQAFRDSGLFHILSISGLHMVIMAGAVFLSIRLLLAAIPSIALRYPIKKWAAAGAMLGALGYLLISGAAFATVRSYIMISIMFLAVLLDRPALALRNVALAALLILVVWPESLLDAGLPDVVCGGGGAGVGLRMAARARRGARSGAARAACSARRCCSSAASSPRRWWRASRSRRSASTIFTTRSSSRSSPTCWRFRPAISSSCRRGWPRWWPCRSGWRRCPCG